MKLLKIMTMLLLVVACQEVTKEEPVQAREKEVATKPEFQPEGQRNIRGFPIGTIQEATQLMNGMRAKKDELNRRMAEMMKDQSKGAELLEMGKPLEELIPVFRKFDSLTHRIEQGLEVDFLSDRDYHKIEYRKQKPLDALIDSLAYVNSLYDKILTESDLKLMKEAETHQ